MRRRGALLVIVAGAAALIASLAITFLVRTRSDVGDMEIAMGAAQSRLMLVAACQYIQESSRIGWDQECYGWIDVRDGRIGPKPTANGADDDSRFPIGGTVRCPMYVMRRPPFALTTEACRNPIETDPGSPRFGVPWLARPDPMPATTSFSDWVAGDRAARANSLHLGWFRVHRKGPARFVITAGAGGTMGYRSWTEVPAEDRTALGGDPAVFTELQARELRLWYEVQWSAAVQANYQTYTTAPESSQRLYTYDNGTGTKQYRTGPDHYSLMPFNASHQGGNDAQSQSLGRNLGGTIQWIQRLETEPPAW